MLPNFAQLASYFVKPAEMAPAAPTVILVELAEVNPPELAIIV